MGTFSGIVRAKKLEKAEQEAASMASKTEEQSARQMQIEEFELLLATVVFRVFDQFVAEVAVEGIAATKEARLGHAPTGRASLRLRADGGKLDINASDESVWEITLLNDGRIEFRSYPDMRVRPGIKSASHDSLIVQKEEVTTNRIEEELARFLQDSINSRD